MKGNFNFQSIWCDLRFILGLVGGIPDRWLESPVAVYTLTLISGLLFTSALLRTTFWNCGQGNLDMEYIGKISILRLNSSFRF